MPREELVAELGAVLLGNGLEIGSENREPWPPIWATWIRCSG